MYSVWMSELVGAIQISESRMNGNSLSLRVLHGYVNEDPIHALDKENDTSTANHFKIHTAYFFKNCCVMQKLLECMSENVYFIGIVMTNKYYLT